MYLGEARGEHEAQDNHDTNKKKRKWAYKK